MNPDSLKKVVEQWMAEVWQKRDVEAVDELHTSDFVDRSPAGRSPDNKGFKEGLVRLYEAFPDFFATTEDLVIDATEGKVAVRWSAVGTHTREFMGAPPTGKRITFRGVEILRIENDRIAERWGEWDSIDLSEQLGSFPFFKVKSRKEKKQDRKTSPIRIRVRNSMLAKVFFTFAFSQNSGVKSTSPCSESFA